MIKDIVCEALRLLNLDALADAMAAPSEEESKEISKFYKYADFVLSEIFTVFFPVIKRVKTYHGGGILEYADIDVSLIAVKTVKTRPDVRIRRLTEGLEMDKCEAEIVYSARTVLSPESELPKTGVSERTVILGLMTEYYLANGMYELAATYDKRYRDGIKSESRKSGVSIKTREWI